MTSVTGREAYVIDAVRTPVGKRGGSLSGQHPADLGAHVIRSVVERPHQTIDPFSMVGPRAEPGLVHLDTLPVSPWPMTPASVVDVCLVAPPGRGPVPQPARPARPDSCEKSMNPYGTSTCTVNTTPG